MTTPISAQRQQRCARRQIIARLEVCGLSGLSSCDADSSPVATPAQDNLFEWHFVMRGAWDSDFSGGIYHGRILLPAEYPFKPPSFVMATPSGRWETGVKICLSISSHHPESWQPTWTVRAALIALRVFMQTPAAGALGALDSPSDVRRALALESRSFVPRSSDKGVQEQIDGLHSLMLESESASRAMHEGQTTSEADGAGPSADGASSAAGGAAVGADPAGSPGPAESPALNSEGEAQGDRAAPPAPPHTAETEPALGPIAADPAPVSPVAATAEAPASSAGLPTSRAAAHPPLQAPPVTHSADPTRGERGLMYFAVALILVIISVLVRRVRGVHRGIEHEEARAEGSWLCTCVRAGRRRRADARACLCSFETAFATIKQHALETNNHMPILHCRWCC